MNARPSATARVIRVTLATYIDPANPYHRRSLKRLATRYGVTPQEVVRLTHRGGLVVYRVDRLKRLHLITEYRCL